MASYLVQITGGNAQGPFNIYYDIVASLTTLATNISKTTLETGYVVTVPDTATNIIILNTAPGCSNTVSVLLPNITPTPTTTVTPTRTPTTTSTPTQTPTITPTSTVTPSSTPGNTPTPTTTPTITVTVSLTPSTTATPTSTPTSTSTPTVTVSNTPTPTPTTTISPTPTTQGTYDCPVETLNNVLTSSGVFFNEYYVNLGTNNGTVCIQTTIVQGSNDTCNCILVYYGSDIVSTTYINVNEIDGTIAQNQFEYLYNASSGSLVRVVHTADPILCNCTTTRTPTPTPTTTTTPTLTPNLPQSSTPTPTTTTTITATSNNTPTPTATTSPQIISGDSLNTFTVLPDSLNDYKAPARGFFNWNGWPWSGDGTGYWAGVPQLSYIDPSDPDAAPQLATGNLDLYWRMSWSDLEPTNEAQYDWSQLDNYLISCITSSPRKKFHFSVMACYQNDTMPLWLRNYSDADGPAVKTVNGEIIPVYWHPKFLQAVRRFYTDIYNRLATNSTNGVSWLDALGSVMIRIYGFFGEWHHSGLWQNPDGGVLGPNGANVLPRDLTDWQALISAQVDPFTDHYITIPIASGMPRSAGYYNEVPDNVSDWIWTNVATNRGYIGWRVDHTGDCGICDELNQNSTSGILSSLKQNRWKYAKVWGEPNNNSNAPWNSCCSANDSYYGSLTGSGSPTQPNELVDLHFSMLGNGNYTVSGSQLTAHLNVASKRIGYKIVLTGGTCPNTLTRGSSFIVSLGWRNEGVAPVYEKWDVYYELRNITTPNTVAWTQQAAMYKFAGNEPSNPLGMGENTLLLPANIVGTYTHVQTFNIPNTLTPGTYQLCLVLKDRTGYRQPLPLHIYGRVAGDYPNGGYYILKTVTIQ